MGQLVELVTPLHKKTQRDYLARMLDDKVHCMEKAREYGRDYWDGDRRYGYGGYRYIPGYWQPVAEQLIARYGLTDESKILDVGCGKAHLLYELHRLLPGAIVRGFDVSQHGINDSPISWALSLGGAEDPKSYKWNDQYFDLVLAMGSLHNLELQELAIALREISRVGRQSYLWVESYDDAESQFGLMCWALTARAFYSVTEWEWLLQHFGYDGDREYVFFRKET